MERRANKQKLQDEVVRYDESGVRVSDRQKGLNDHRCGCKVEYYISYRKRKDQWIGTWKCPPEDHSSRLSPFDSTYWVAFEREIESYSEMQMPGSKLRYSKVPYRQARKMFSDEGIGMLMSQKESYNLANQPIRDINRDDTPGALLAVFDQAGLKFLLRLQHTVGVRKIVQIFFWCDRTRLRSPPNTVELVHVVRVNSLFLALIRA